MFKQIEVEMVWAKAQRLGPTSELPPLKVGEPIIQKKPSSSNPKAP